MVRKSSANVHTFLSSLSAILKKQLHVSFDIVDLGEKGINCSFLFEK